MLQQLPSPPPCWRRRLPPLRVRCPQASTCRPCPPPCGAPSASQVQAEAPRTAAHLHWAPARGHPRHPARLVAEADPLQRALALPRAFACRGRRRPAPPLTPASLGRVVVQGMPLRIIMRALALVLSLLLAVEVAAVRLSLARSLARGRGAHLRLPPLLCLALGALARAVSSAALLAAQAVQAAAHHLCLSLPVPATGSAWPMRCSSSASLAHTELRSWRRPCAPLLRLPLPLPPSQRRARRPHRMRVLSPRRPAGTTS